MDTASNYGGRSASATYSSAASASTASIDDNNTSTSVLAKMLSTAFRVFGNHGNAAIIFEHYVYGCGTHYQFTAAAVRHPLLLRFTAAARAFLGKHGMSAS